MTPNSSLVPYASVSDWLIRQDSNLIAQLCTDDGIIPTQSQLLDSTTMPGLIALTMLMDASGEIEYAATRGERYQPSDLASLTGVSQALLKGMTCDIAMMNLWDRRDGQNPPENVVEKYKRAQGMLDQLVKGERVFGDLQNQSAGPAKTAFFTPSDLINNRLISSLYPRYYGRRANQVPWQ